MSEYSAAPQSLSRLTLAGSYNSPMRADLRPFRALLPTVSGRVNRHRQQVIEYLIEENHRTCAGPRVP